MKSGAPRAIAAALVLSAAFEALLFGSKEAPAIYSHAPWLNDPYDTAVSFALFCTPLIIAPSALRLIVGSRLPDRGQPERLADLLRASGVALAVLAVTLAACWAAVAAGANRAAWTSVTGAQVAVLALLSAGTVACAVGIRRAARDLRLGSMPVRHDAERSGTAPDWLGDLIGAGRLLAGLGLASRPLTRVLDWTDDQVLPLVRGHPVGAAATLSAAVGLLVAISQGVTEGYRPLVAAVFFCVATSGVFAFVVAAGWYLRVVRTGRPEGLRAPVMRATVVAAAAVPVALAFRTSLWSLAGAHPHRGGLGPLAVLLVSAAALAFCAAIAAERLTRAGRRGRPSGASADSESSRTSAR